jgi:hypothetical protein
LASITNLRTAALSLVMATACGPSSEGEDDEDDVVDAPRCDDLPTRVVVDHLALPESDLAAVIADTEDQLFRRIGAYLVPRAIYEGSIVAGVEGESDRMETSQAFATRTERRTGNFQLIARDFETDVMFGLEHSSSEEGVEASMTPWSASAAYTCSDLPFDLANPPSEIETAEVTCRLSDPTEPTLKFELDLAARSADEVEIEELRRAAELSYSYGDAIDEFEAHGPLYVRDLEDTYERDLGLDSYTDLYIDYEATWWFCADEVGMNGVSKIEVTFAERCSCLGENHCHGRYEADCIPYN